MRRYSRITTPIGIGIATVMVTTAYAEVKISDPVTVDATFVVQGTATPPIVTWTPKDNKGTVDAEVGTLTVKIPDASYGGISYGVFIEKPDGTAADGYTEFTNKTMGETTNIYMTPVEPWVRAKKSGFEAYQWVGTSRMETPPDLTLKFTNTRNGQLFAGEWSATLKVQYLYE